MINHMQKISSRTFRKKDYGLNIRKFTKKNFYFHQ